MIYFITDGASVKIGTSANVEARLLSIRNASPNEITLIGTIEGDERHERAIHRELSHYRIRREWFADCEQVRRAIVEYQERGIEIDESDTKETHTPHSLLQRVQVAAQVLIQREQLAGYGKMEAYRRVANSVGMGHEWIRKFLDPKQKTLEPRFSTGYALLLRAGMIQEVVNQTEVYMQGILERAAAQAGSSGADQEGA